MLPYKRILWEKTLEELFDRPERTTVLDWLVASEGRPRVVLVGAGFTRNAIVRSKRPVSVAVPLWADVVRAMAEDLGLRPATYDPLTLADIYQARLGRAALQHRMLSLLEDADLEPGEAHAALLESEAHAIVTTNFLDTVLDRYVNRTWTRVLLDVDLAKTDFRRPDEPPRQLIYFHGHRDTSDTWVLTRCQYDDIVHSRPLIVARVRQLFAQFPLLVVGYSLNDPDFHALYRDTARSMNKSHPLGLVLLPKPTEPEPGMELYWGDLGLRVATLSGAASSSLGQSFAKFFRLNRTRFPLSTFVERLRAW